MSTDWLCGAGWNRSAVGFIPYAVIKVDVDLRFSWDGSRRLVTHPGDGCWAKWYLY